MPKRVVLIDGTALIFRAYYAIPSSFTTAAGLHTNAIYGFALMFRKLLAGKQPDMAAVVFDAAGPTFRDEEYAEYKANRDSMPDELAEQTPWIEKVVRAHDYPVLRIKGYEADDVIGTLTREAVEAGHEVQIISGDKDFAQVIGPDVVMIDTMRDITYDAELVRKKWGVGPSKFVDFLALVGDSVDNVPGVPGIGKKTAASLLETYENLDEILANTEQLKGRARKNLEEYREQAILSRRLVTIDQNVPLDVHLDDLKVSPPDRKKVNALYRELEFYSLLSAEGGEGTAGLDADEFDVVDSIDALESLLERLANETVAVAPLYEPWDHMRGRLVGVALGETDGRAHYVPIEASDDALGSQAVMRLRPFLEDPEQPKIVHNLRDELCVFSRHSIALRGVVADTQLASFLVDPTRIIPHDLNQVVKEYLHRTVRPLKTLVGSGKSIKRLDQLPVGSVAPWACHIAAAIAELWEPLEERLVSEKQREALDTLAMPMAYVLADMQMTGIRVDSDDLAQMEVEFVERRDTVEAHIHELAGKEFNVGSTKQLSEVLFEDLGLPVIKRTKTGYSTAAEVLERLADEHEIAHQILQWRSLAKLVNTYTRVLRESVNPETERIHATFQQTAGASGRLITTDPDLQRTPIRGEDGKRIRRAFIPRDGWVMVSADWSQIELRMLAHFCRDPLLVSSFEEDVDLHRRTASQLFDVPAEEVTPRQRNMGKTVNFATIYGQGATALSKQLAISRKEASRLIERYFEAYAGVRTWLDETVATAHERGFVTTLLGRKRYIPELQSNNPTDRAYGERVATNTPIQGSAADLCKLAMLQIAERFEQEELESKMLLQIHDELVFEAPPEEVDTVLAIVRDRMEHAHPLGVPLKVDIGTGDSWAAAH